MTVIYTRKFSREEKGEKLQEVKPFKETRDLAAAIGDGFFGFAIGLGIAVVCANLVESDNNGELYNSLRAAYAYGKIAQESNKKVRELPVDYVAKNMKLIERALKALGSQHSDLGLNDKLKKTFGEEVKAYVNIAEYFSFSRDNSVLKSLCQSLGSMLADEAQLYVAIGKADVLRGEGLDEYIWSKKFYQDNLSEALRLEEDHQCVRIILLVPEDRFDELCSDSCYLPIEVCCVVLGRTITNTELENGFLEYRSLCTRLEETLKSQWTKNDDSVLSNKLTDIFVVIDDFCPGSLEIINNLLHGMTNDESTMDGREQQASNLSDNINGKPHPHYFEQDR